MIYLVRHGQTVFNAELRLQGRLDSPLTDRGRSQGLALGLKLRALLGHDGVPIESSPQDRARGTAEIIRSAMGGEGDIRLDPRLREISLGSWEGLTQQEIEARWPGVWRGTVRQSWVESCPDGETYEAAEARLKDWLDESLEGPTRVVVSHGVSIGILRGLYLGLDRAETLAFPVPQGVIWTFEGGDIHTLAA
jgi:broad specificity phosphatase PhoE